MALISGTAVTFSSGRTQTSAAVVGNGSWQDVTGSRAWGTTYTNSTGYPIWVFITANTNVNGGVSNLFINGTQYLRNSLYSNAYVETFIVPSGNTYQMTGPFTLKSWAEYR